MVKLMLCAAIAAVLTAFGAIAAGAETVATVAGLTGLGLGLTLYLFGPKLAALPDGWLKRWLAADKLLHFAVSALLVVGIARMLGVWPAAAVALAVGVLKEIYDRLRGGRFCLHDLAADIVGVAVGVLLAA